MKLKCVKGNTYVLEAAEALIPFYRLPDNTCILLDTGLLVDREDMEQTLLDHGLTPAGILCSHAHVDHCASNGYFQEKYHIPVALTYPESGMCSTLLTLKCYFLTLSPDIVRQDASHMIHRPDVIIPDNDCTFEFCGVPFQIIQTPGHSSGHIAVITPDNVCYTGDALLSRECQAAKLPYALHHRTAIESRQKLIDLPCDYFIMAHQGVCTGADFPSLVRDNDELIYRRAGEILSLIQGPVLFSDINRLACAHFKLLTRQPRRALRFERNVRFFVDFLTEEGYLDMSCTDGTVFYTPSGKTI